MNTMLVTLKDGVMVEVEEPENHQVGTSKLESTFEKVRPLLLNTCQPIVSVWHELNKEVKIKQAEIELGLSFEAEGNLYITKSKANANLTIKFIIVSPDDDDDDDA